MEQDAERHCGCHVRDPPAVTFHFAPHASPPSREHGRGGEEAWRKVSRGRETDREEGREGVGEEGKCGRKEEMEMEIEQG